MFEWITGIIARRGYAGVAALTFLENVFPPIPSELVIPLAGFVAGRGELRFILVVLAASVGSLAGAAVWYELGRRIGKERLRGWIERHGKWLTLSGGDVDRADEWFHRHGGIAVLLGRLVPGVRTFISLPAGFVRMPRLPFLLYSAVGTLAWTAALGYAGMILQANFMVVGTYMELATDLLLAAGAVLMVKRYVQCWRASRHS